MSEHKKHIDDLFKKGLGDYTETPPPAVWDALEKRLDGKKDKRGFGWFWPLAILSFVVLFGGTIAWRLSNSSSPKEIARTTDKTSLNVEKSQAIAAERPTPSHEIVKANTETVTEKQDQINTENVTNVGNFKTAKPHHTETTGFKNINNRQDADINNVPISEKKMVQTHADPKNNNNTQANDALTANNKTNLLNPDSLQNANKDVAVKNPENINNKGIEKAAVIKEKIVPASKVIEGNVSAPVTLTKKQRTQVQKIPQTNTDTTKQTVLNKTRADNKKKQRLIAKTILASNKLKHSTGDVVVKKVKNITKDSSGIIKPVPEIACVKSKNLQANKAHVKVPQTAIKAVNVAKENSIKKVAKEDVSQKVKKPENIATITPVQKQPIETSGNEVVAKSNTEPAERGPRPAAPESEYNAKPSVPAAKETAIQIKPIPELVKIQESKIPGTFKEEKLLALNTAFQNNYPATTLNNTATDTPVSLSNWNRWEEGVKAGFESGVNSNAGRKVVFAAYLQYSLNSRFALMLQPSIKSSFINNRNLQGIQSFYKQNGDSSVTATKDNPIAVIGSNNQLDTILWTKTYTYSQTHDSLVKSYVYGGSYIEFELPVLLKYKITNRLSVYGGVNIVYGKLATTAEKTYTSQHILQTADSLVIWPFGGTAPSPLSVNSVIKYSGKPISAYPGPLYPSQNGDLWRFGYMLGFSYEFRKKWLFDVLIQQSSAKSNVQGAYDINKPLTLPYFRLMLGYRLGNFPIRF